MFRRVIVRSLLVLVLLSFAIVAQADVFYMPSDQTSLQFVTVGDPGNTADTTVMNDSTTGYGSVPYVYQMGKYDVTVGQYCQFLNAVAKMDTYGLYNVGGPGYDGGMALDFPTFGIAQNGSSGNYSYSVTGGYSQGVNCPMFSVSWGSAARFCNWLQNGQPTGAEGAGTTETGAYTLNGAVTKAALMGITRNTGATYFIPSENEWYKAAYYKGGGTNAGYWLYPTQSNTPPSNVFSATGINNANISDNDSDIYPDPTNWLTPVGAFAASPGPYGTFDMGGDVWQWNEWNQTVMEEYDWGRGVRGGDFENTSDWLAASLRCYFGPVYEAENMGFRVASVPEPGSITLLFAGIACLLAYAWRRRK